MSWQVLCTSKSPESSDSRRLMRSSWKRFWYASLIRVLWVAFLWPSIAMMAFPSAPQPTMMLKPNRLVCVSFTQIAFQSTLNVIFVRGSFDIQHDRTHKQTHPYSRLFSIVILKSTLWEIWHTHEIFKVSKKLLVLYMRKNQITLRTDCYVRMKDWKFDHELQIWKLMTEWFFFLKKMKIWIMWPLTAFRRDSASSTGEWLEGAISVAMVELILFFLLYATS